MRITHVEYMLFGCRKFCEYVCEYCRHRNDPWVFVLCNASHDVQQVWDLLDKHHGDIHKARLANGSRSPCDNRTYTVFGFLACTRYMPDGVCIVYFVPAFCARSDAYSVAHTNIPAIYYTSYLQSSCKRTSLHNRNPYIIPELWLWYYCHTCNH